jgi:hypothetical protein
MSPKPHREAFSRALLQDTDAMARKFHAFGLECIPNWVIALRLGCHVNTVGTFLRRAPKSKAALARGREEAAARKRRPGGSARRAEQAWRDANRPDAPKPGENCPTCGHPVVDGEEFVVFTTAELAESRRKFEDMIDRKIAAREAEEGRDGDAS